MNHYSPFKVAEMFKQLEAMFPGRIDLGMGRLLSDQEKEQPTRIVDGQWSQFVAGGPQEVRAALEQMAEESGADEVMVQNLIADPADRRHSHQLLADMFSLRPPRLGA